MKFSFIPQLFSDFFLLGSGSGSWPASRFHYEIHWNKLFFIYLRYPPNLVSLRKVFVKVKIHKVILVTQSMKIVEKS